jgi:hypothetical protein
MPATISIFEVRATIQDLVWKSESKSLSDVLQAWTKASGLRLVHSQVADPDVSLADEAVKEFRGEMIIRAPVIQPIEEGVVY